MKKIKLNPRLNQIEILNAHIEKILWESHISLRHKLEIRIMIDEIYSNIVKYSGATQAYITCEIEEGILFMQFCDDGTPYDPTQKEAPDITLSAEKRQAGGLGIFMVKEMAKSVQYEYKNGYNILVIKKAV